MTEVKDVFGTEIHIGDTVVYSMRKGVKAYLKSGVVTSLGKHTTYGNKVREYDVSAGILNAEGYQIHIHDFSRIAVMKIFRGGI